MKVMQNVRPQGWMSEAVEVCGPDHTFRVMSYQNSCCGWVMPLAFCDVILITLSLAAAEIRDGWAVKMKGTVTPVPALPIGFDTLPSNWTKRNPCGETKAS